MLSIVLKGRRKPIEEIPPSFRECKCSCFGHPSILIQLTGTIGSFYCWKLKHVNQHPLSHLKMTEIKNSLSFTILEENSHNPKILYFIWMYTKDAIIIIFFQFCEATNRNTTPGSHYYGATRLSISVKFLSISIKQGGGGKGK